MLVLDRYSLDILLVQTSSEQMKVFFFFLYYYFYIKNLNIYSYSWRIFFISLVL